MGARGEMKLIAIDPGKVCLGWASFKDARLVAAGIIENNTRLVATYEPLEDVMHGEDPSCVIIEVPQVYPQRAQKGDPNDLIDVAVIAGVVAGLALSFVEPQLVKPHAWKGNRPKTVDNEYTLSLLKPDELKIVNGCGASKSKLHNVIDAVGIGLWKLGRR